MPKPMTHGADADGDRDPRAVDDAREDVAAEVVGAEEVVQRRTGVDRRCSPGRADSGRGRTLAKMAPMTLSPIQPTQIQKKSPEGLAGSSVQLETERTCSSSDVDDGAVYSRLILGSTILMMKSKMKLMSTTTTDTDEDDALDERGSRSSLIASDQRVAEARNLQAGTGPRSRRRAGRRC